MEQAVPGLMSIAAERVSVVTARLQMDGGALADQILAKISVAAGSASSVVT